MNNVIRDQLAVRRNIAIVFSVEIKLANFERILPQITRDIVDNVFDCDRTLRPAKTAKCSVRLRIGLRAKRIDRDIVNIIGIVQMADCTRYDRSRKVGRKSCLRSHFNIDRPYQSIVIEAYFIFIMEPMPFSGCHHVVVTVEAQFDRAVQSVGRDRGDTGEDRRL